MAKDALTEIIQQNAEWTLGELLLRTSAALTTLGFELGGPTERIAEEIENDIKYFLEPAHYIATLPLPKAMNLTPTFFGNNLKIDKSNITELSAMFGKRERVRMYRPLWAIRMYAIQPIINFINDKWPCKTIEKWNTSGDQWAQKDFWSKENMEKSQRVIIFGDAGFVIKLCLGLYLVDTGEL